MNNERLINVTMGEDDAIEKEPLKCLKGHDFVLNKGPKLNFYGDKRETRYCLICKKGWYYKDVDCHVICKERDCDTAELCKECSVCPKGHLMNIRYKRPWKYENVQCNRCYMD